MTVLSGTAEQLLKGEDRTLADEALGLFGVFDGLGGYMGGDIAAATAARATADFIRSHSPPPDKPAAAETLKKALLSANERILAKQKGELGDMATTATVFWLVSGLDCGVYAHAGDSRLYLVRASRLEQITRDEGEGNFINNFLGGLRTIEQFGVIELSSGDRLSLVTDGITGDWPAEALSEQELLEALDGRHAAEAAAEQLIAISRKRDDKSAIVVDVC